MRAEPHLIRHQLPFGAQMTDRLFQLVKDPKPHSPHLHAPHGDSLRSIEWAPQSCAVPGKAGWLLSFISRSQAEPERVFDVDGVHFYIPARVEPLLREQVFDWDDLRGVVSQQA